MYFPEHPVTLEFMSRISPVLLLLSALCAFGCSPGPNGDPAGPAVPSPPENISAPITDSKPAIRPNILLIVADDLGYTDLSSYGGEIPTPNIDALAAQGLQLTRFYTNMTCSPTRAMLLTGVDNHLAGLGNMAETIAPNQRGLPGYETYLNDQVISIAELLQTAGYNTFMTGKWHLGLEYDQSPKARGFDRSFALLFGAASHFDDMAGAGLDRPRALYREDGELLEALPQGFYSTDFYTDRMIRYIEQARQGRKPFLAYLAYTAPHWPLQAPDNYLQKYRGKYDEGYDIIRARRFDRLHESGLIPESAALPPRPAHIPPWEDLPEAEQQLRARHMEVYAAMVDNLDYNIGRMIGYLKDTGEFENTFIIFISDNGADAFTARVAPPILEFSEQFNNRLENIGRKNSYALYGPWWAHVGEAPFRLYKGTSAEGGIRVPAIISYPGSGQQNAINDHIMTVLDIFPTFVELAGVEHPGDRFSGKKLHQPSGRSLLPALSGENHRIHPAGHAFGIELWGKTALLMDNWKMLKMPPDQGTGSWELFNLEQDPGEQHDLARARPEKLEEMLSAWEEYAAANNVILPEGPFRIHSPASLPDR